jgi:hypothetical protein
MAFWLEQQRADPPVEKTYPRPHLKLSAGLLVALEHGEIVGYATCNSIPGTTERGSSTFMSHEISVAVAWDVRSWMPVRRWPAECHPPVVCG